MAKKKESTTQTEEKPQAQIELAPREQANYNAVERIKTMLSTATCRDGSEFEVSTIQFDLSGAPSTIKGKANGIELFWNILGTALRTQDRGLDLVNEEKI